MSTEKQYIEEKEASSMKLITTLSVAGFISGLILVSVYLFTKPYIAENRARALEQAIFEVLPGTAHFDVLTWNGTALVQADSQSTGGETIYFGRDSLEQFTGIAIPGEESGYQDIISALFGYDPDDKIIIGLKILESKETPGLGDKILFDPDFTSNFTKLSVEPEITVVKKGSKNKPSEIEAITGATISSKAIGRLLQDAVADWKPRIDAYMQNQEK